MGQALFRAQRDLFYNCLFLLILNNNNSPYNNPMCRETHMVDLHIQLLQGLTVCSTYFVYFLCPHFLRMEYFKATSKHFRL